VEEPLRALMGNHIYGCDDCLAACPWNKFAVEAHELRYAAKDDLIAPKLAELVVLTDVAFREKFSGSPVKRIGRNRFVRNVLYAIGNGGDADLLSLVAPLCHDEDATVKDAANWACAQLTL
jgi:epoxyqueuosine reductase